MNEEKDYEGKKIDPQTWKTLLAFAAPKKKYYLIILLGSMAAGIIATAMSFMSRWAIDGFMIPGTTDKVWLFAAAAILLQLMMAALTLIYCRSASVLETYLNAEVRRAAYTRLQSMSFSYFDKTSTGHLISRITGDISRIMEMVSWTCIDLGWGIMAVAASLIAMFLVNLKLALITLAAVPLVALLSLWFQKKILKYQRKTRRLNSMITSSFNEGIMGAQTSKILNREALNDQEFAQETRDMFKASMRSATISAVYMPLASLVISLATGCILIAGGHDVQRGVLTIGTLNFFINIGSMMFEPIRNFAGIFSEFQSCQAAAERVADVLQCVSEIEDSPEVIEKYGDFFHPKKENWEPIRGDVDFDHVSFWYLPGEPVLTDFCLHVKAGENIALVGETGGGKSTIVNLLCRFYEPGRGSSASTGKTTGSGANSGSRAAWATSSRPPTSSPAASWRTSATAVWRPRRRKSVRPPAWWGRTNSSKSWKRATTRTPVRGAETSPPARSSLSPSPGPSWQILLSSCWTRPPAPSTRFRSSASRRRRSRS